MSPLSETSMKSRGIFPSPASRKIPPSFRTTRNFQGKLFSQSVHTASPGFIGHMTSALPYFMLPLSRILTALNQNLVKVEIPSLHAFGAAGAGHGTARSPPRRTSGTSWNKSWNWRRNIDKNTRIPISGRHQRSMHPSVPTSDFQGTL